MDGPRVPGGRTDKQRAASAAARARRASERGEANRAASETRTTGSPPRRRGGSEAGRSGGGGSEAGRSGGGGSEAGRSGDGSHVQVLGERRPEARPLAARRPRQAEMLPRVDRELFGQPSGRRASAGRVIAVGLLCFGLWTLFDANQLLHNAIASPFGTRRSVSISVLRPIAALADAIGFSGPVNAANSALGRGGPGTNSTLPPPPIIPVVVPRPPNDANTNGVAPRPHTKPGQQVPTTTPTRVWPPPLRQPTAAHPLVMLDIGDSIGEDLGFGLGDLFSSDAAVKVLQRGHIDSGLALPQYYNWPAVLNADIKQYHPGVVVIMMGANDDTSLAAPGGQVVSPETKAWDRVYSQRIALLMDEAIASGAHVMWVGLPPLQDANVNSSFALHVNGLARLQVAAHPGTTYVPSWGVLAGPGGRFVEYKTIGGTVQQIRYSDGIHLAPAGWDLLANSLLHPMEQAWHVNLHA